MPNGRVVVTIVAGVGCVALFAAGEHFAAVRPTGPLSSQSLLTREHRGFAEMAAAGFFLLASYTIRRLANELAASVSRADRASASPVRLIVTIAGMILAALLALAILRIGVSQILLGGAIGGIVLGIAAQQSLGNMFAGIVLMVARPFRAGDDVLVRTGSLGGPFQGHVESMGLIYVAFLTVDGPTVVPNLTLLASGIVRLPAGTGLAAPAPAQTAPAPAPVDEPSSPNRHATDSLADGDGADRAP